MKYYLVKFNESTNMCGLQHLDGGYSQVLCAESEKHNYYWYYFEGGKGLEYSNEYTINFLRRYEDCEILKIAKSEYSKLILAEEVFRELSR